MLRLRKSLTCRPLRSTCFRTLPHYYEAIRLLTGLRSALRLQDVACTYRSFFPRGTRQISRVCTHYFVCSPRSIDPGGTYTLSRSRVPISACGVEEHIGFHSSYLTGLNRFTLAHCGSHTPMPTLKPRLTASAPRLGTGCSLCFARPGISPSYIACTVPAHPRL